MHDRYLQLFKEVDEEDNGSMDFPEFLLMMRKSAAVFRGRKSCSVKFSDSGEFQSS